MLCWEKLKLGKMSLKIKYISIIITCSFHNQSDSEIALLILEIIICFLNLNFD